MNKISVSLIIRIFLAALMLGLTLGRLTRHDVPHEDWEAPFYMALVTFVIVTDCAVTVARAFLIPSEDRKT